MIQKLLSRLDLRLIQKLFPDLQEEAFFELIEKSDFFWLF